VVNTALGAAGNVIGGAAFPTKGMLPQNLSNLWDPGINTLRLYGQAGLAGLVGAFGAAAQATPAYADRFCGGL
jgi:hypothetical protein